MTDHAHEIMRLAKESEEEGGRVVARRQGITTFVAGERKPDLPQAIHTMTLDVAPNAQAGIVEHTSAVDRAKGFALGARELGLVLGALAVIVAVVGLEYPLISGVTLLTFGLVYAACWVVGYIWSQLVSPAGALLFESKRKWDHLDEARRERWYYWAVANGLKPYNPSPHLMKVLLHPLVLIVLIICTTALLITGLVLTFGNRG